ncbi:MAG: LPP20 family lipoprotein [Candidatus Cloacimonetes bacterium]|nr:LPP20 family lipoprotein [Candidatus Cloacimonadota bacterium]
MKKITLITILLLLVFIGCISALSARRDVNRQNERPQWLINPQSLYPESMYMIAIGEGDNRSRAEADAAANLAKIFETRVEAEEIYQERYKEMISERSLQAEILTDIDRSVALSASQTLYNIQYAESYTDDLGRTYVLAYIDRHRTADIYMNMIENHNQRIVSYLDRAENSDYILHRYAYWSAATVISTINEDLLSQLQIIAPDYRSMIMLDYDHNELLLDTRNLAHNLKFKINQQNDEHKRIYSVISELLTSHGFTIDEEGEVTIDYEVLLEDVDLQRTEKFVRWHLNIHMNDGEGRMVITHSQRGREGHINQPEAVARAYKAMEREIRQDFNRKIFSYFDKLAN